MPSTLDFAKCHFWLPGGATCVQNPPFYVPSIVYMQVIQASLTHSQQSQGSLLKYSDPQQQINKLRSVATSLSSLIMALRLMVGNYWKSTASGLRGNATYATSTTPKMKAYAPTADFGHVHGEHGKRILPVNGDFVPVYVALGMIVLSTSLGLFTGMLHLRYSPSVRVRKKTRETVPEVYDPDKVVDEAENLVKKSLFRKLAHLQEFESGLQYIPDPTHKDIFASQPQVETLKDVGIDPKQFMSA